MIVHDVDKLFDQILSYFAKRDGGHFLQIAKTKYFSLTGNVDHDTQDFEHKMKSFTEWFILHYTPFRSGKKIFKLYHEEVGINDLLLQVSSTVLYSVFDPISNVGDSKSIIFDCIHQKRYQLMKEHNPFLIVKGELFVGRLLKTKDGIFLLKGVVPLPYEVRDWVIKQAVLVQKKQISYMPEEFCLELEGMKYRALQYQHIDPEKIFDLQY